jgi:DNA-binding response OmpR family regulator
MKDKAVNLDKVIPLTYGVNGPKKILVVDDDKELRANLSVVLEDIGYITDTAPSAAEALTKSSSVDFDIVLLDLMIPEASGMEVLGELRKITPRTKVIMITAFASVDTAVEAMKKGASDYISKPFTVQNLDITLKKTLEEARFSLDVKQLGLDETIGSLSNYIRRDIIKLVNLHKGMRLMELTRALEIDDHTKVVFHLKVLRDSGILHQEEKTYYLTKEGDEMLNALRLLENHLSQ